MTHEKHNNPAASTASTTVEWLLAALAAVACFAIPVLALPSSDTLWPMPGLMLLGIALLGIAGFAGIAAGRGWLALRGPTLAWIACGALAALGVIGAFGVSLIVITWVPAVLFGLAAALATHRLGRGWREGLTMLVLGAGGSAVLLFVLISLR